MSTPLLPTDASRLDFRGLSSLNARWYAPACGAERARQIEYMKSVRCSVCLAIMQNRNKLYPFLSQREIAQPHLLRRWQGAKVEGAGPRALFLACVGWGITNEHNVTRMTYRKGCRPPSSSLCSSCQYCPNRFSSHALQHSTWSQCQQS
jgi:hypothetical protein